ncbi:MAG: 3D domain-containing protein [Chitinophagales bacterium]
MGLAVACLCVLFLAVYLCLEKSVTIKVDNQVIKDTTFKKTVAEVLTEKGIKLYDKDLIEPGINTELKEGMSIKITRAFPVNVTADGASHQVVSIPVTVKDLLGQANVSLGPKDLVSADLESLTTKGQTIKVTRVTEKVIEDKSEIPFRKISISDTTLERGLSRTKTKGRPGLASETIKITYHDGKEIRREVLSAKVLRQPVNQVMAMGTITSVSRGGLRLDFTRAMIAGTTAYTYTGHRTSSGKTPSVGLVAVDPRVIPMGTRLYIEGYGFARAADRGSGIKGNEVDVFLESVSQCRKWGRRTVKVYMLRE